ncbi:MAG TPA: prolyl oligopeptidase family serine peptidase, partial [Burkholderiales bacterium]|nr:prolyl oligopeptidase family serine peptidase [Burkholderiales bacterium]
YSNSYAVNQYLANHGFIVLSVNYRLGIGYGHDFHYPEHWGPTGAAEYQDVVAGAKWLQNDPRVDPQRIGMWGGSYGGYLTALALARIRHLRGRRRHARRARLVDVRRRLVRQATRSLSDARHGGTEKNVSSPEFMGELRLG